MMSVKSRLSSSLSQRSVVRRYHHPDRANTWHAVRFALGALPVAVLLVPVFGIRTLFFGQLPVTVLAAESEFGPSMHLMEYIRGRGVGRREVLFMQSTKRHKGFDEIYRREIGKRVFWSHGILGLLQQAILLQPKSFITITRINPAGANTMPTWPVKTSLELQQYRTSLLARVNSGKHNYVTVAVHTSQYDDETNPRYAAQERSRESIGADLAPAIDFLVASGVEVILVGAEDTRISKIPRDIPRLCEFGSHGGLEEVALASGCKYFWTDDVGAFWLAVPFKKPIVFSNFSRILIRRGVQPQGHLVVPIRYQTPSGRLLTFRDLLSTRSPTHKAAAKGELVMIRNSPEEIVEAHREMLARVNGTWKESAESREHRQRLDALFSEFDDWSPLTVSAHFLEKHRYLLD